MRFETRAVHAGREALLPTGDVAPPLHLSTTFERDPAGRPRGGHTYIRESNPTQSQLETALAELEGGEAALVFASGMAAGIALLQALEPGAHVVLPEDVYYGFRDAAHEFLPAWGLRAQFTDTAEPAALRAAVGDGTRVVWLETPSNPQLRITDIAGSARLAREAGALLVVDSTFATPALQRPIEHGADVVLHSATKYMGGHSDVQGGALVFARRDALHDRVARIRHLLGAVLSPFNAWLVLRGLRTLSCRMATHSANALALARALAAHEAVAAVHYPGLESDPGHTLARAQMERFGGMLSFRVRGGREAALAA
ncbi:MAG: PLP-dependent transferase, partial [Gemmatimonadetes bacterium]|nr:PLP-dependent transferase [Gemmatimonadota bacterium]